MNNKGLSMIALVITIIVAVMLAGMALSENARVDTVQKAKDAKWLSAIDIYKEQLRIYYIDRKAENLSYNKALLNANSTSVTYNGVTVTDSGRNLTIKDVVPSINDEDIPKIEVQAGQIVYVGTDAHELEVFNGI